MSLDVKGCYPSISFHLIQKVVLHYAWSLPYYEAITVLKGLYLLTFGMKFQFMRFEGDVYKYGQGHTQDEDRELAIGLEESVWLGYFVATYLLEMCEDILSEDESSYKGIYCGDSMVVYQGKKRTFQKLIELLNVHTHTNTIMSLDVKDYYPSISFHLIQKVVLHYS